MSQDKGIPFTPFRAFEPVNKPYGARFATRSYMRELMVNIGQPDQMFDFSNNEMQGMEPSSLYYTAFDIHGAIEIERVAVLGLKHNVIFKRRAGEFAKLRAHWQHVEVYYN